MKTISSVMFALLFFWVLYFSVDTCIAEGEVVIRIVNAQTGLNSTSLGSLTEPMPPEGYPFTVNVTLGGSVSMLKTFQIGVSFERSKVRCTGASVLSKDDSNYVFLNQTFITSSPVIDNDVVGYVSLGAALIGTNVNVSQKAFCQLNFTAIKTGTFILNVIPTTEDSNSPYYGKDTFLWDRYNNYILFTGKSFTVTILASQSPPIASFRFNPLNPKANETVTFDASESFDPDGEIVSYHWDFGDGNNLTTMIMNATHIFTLNEIYSVKLIVTDNDGFNCSLVKEVYVGGIPKAIFTYDPEEPYAGEQVTFNASGSFDLDGTITLYAWDFGDDSNATTIDPIVTHAFAQNDVYLVNLTVSDNDGLYRATTQYLLVGRRPIVEFVLSPDTPSPDEEIIFDASLSYDIDGEIVRLVWNFGDGNVIEVDVINPSDFIVAHTYLSQGGIYEVNLTIFDNDGLYKSAIRDVIVSWSHLSPKIYNIVWERTIYPLILSSDSDITHFHFNHSLAQITFDLSGVTGAVSYCSIIIPKSLLNGDPWTIKVNDVNWDFSCSDNATHSAIYFTYMHASTLRVTIQGTWVVPEFSSILIIPLFISTTLIVVILFRKKKKQNFNFFVNKSFQLFHATFEYFERKVVVIRLI